MSQIALAAPNLPPLLGPVLTALNHRLAPLALLVVALLMAEVFAIIAFGPVALAMTGLTLVPVIFVLLIIVAGH